MSTPVRVPSPRIAWELPPVLPLDSARWNAWVATGLAREHQSNESIRKAVPLLSVTALLTAAMVWSHLAPYEVVIRFVVSIAAIAIALRSFRLRRYLTSVLFSAMALLYNPILPLFPFSGEWQRTLVVASVLPFAAIIARGPTGINRHE